VPVPPRPTGGSISNSSPPAVVVVVVPSSGGVRVGVPVSPGSPLSYPSAPKAPSTAYLAAALTFVVLGYSPIYVARKGIVIWLMIAALVSLPLYSSFEKMKENITIQKTLANIHFKLQQQEVILTDIQLIQHSKILEVRCEVIASGFLMPEEKILLKEVIEKTIGKKVDVIATFRYRL
jgi:hypothetical protein